MIDTIDRGGNALSLPNIACWSGTLDRSSIPRDFVPQSRARDENPSIHHRPVRKLYFAFPASPKGASGTLLRVETLMHHQLRLSANKCRVIVVVLMHHRDLLTLCFFRAVPTGSKA
jgi:hypothetical protein